MTAQLQTVDRLEDLPDPIPNADFVVVDVIISTTSIVRLLEAGAAFVKPFADTEAALEFGETADDPLLVGEQEGRAIEGFDCGPLPSVLDRHDVEGRPVGILTSNGTRAIDRIGHDRDVFVASTINAGAVASALRDRDADVWLVAAGRRGEPVPEDTAGVELLRRCYTDDLTEAARSELTDRIQSSETAEWIDALGYGHEIEALVEFNASDTVPRLRDGAFVAE